MSNPSKTALTTPAQAAHRIDWSTRTLDISMMAGWTFLLVLTARVLLDF
jgi:hypothetical protein